MKDESKGTEWMQRNPKAYIEMDVENDLRFNLIWRRLDPLYDWT